MEELIVGEGHRQLKTLEATLSEPGKNDVCKATSSCISPVGGCPLMRPPSRAPTNVEISANNVMPVSAKYIMTVVAIKTCHFMLGRERR